MYTTRRPPPCLPACQSIQTPKSAREKVERKQTQTSNPNRMEWMDKSPFLTSSPDLTPDKSLSTDSLRRWKSAEEKPKSSTSSSSSSRWQSCSSKENPVVKSERKQENKSVWQQLFVQILIIFLPTLYFLKDLQDLVQ